jgi:teichuronic acid biosynthesis glycosyltransferase TuaC
MKVLFVSREKANGEISPIVRKQGESLEGLVKVQYFLVKGKGILAYVKNIPRIRSYARKHKVDIIHAHYSLSGFTAALSFSRPVFCSLMGSDIQAGPLVRFLVRLFARFFWKATIVKSERMKEKTGLRHARVIPNGVDMKLFKPVARSLAIDKVSFDPFKKHILFLADPGRPEKNFRLTEATFILLGSMDSLSLHAIHDVEHEDVPNYLNAADVLVITSLWEGSPNAVKEAMACNCPIVSTDVGDVKEVIGNTEGCYITSYDPVDVAYKLKQALDFGKRTNGREKISHLNSKSIAEELIRLYFSIKNTKIN